MTRTVAANRYGVRIVRDPGGWVATIVEADGTVALLRACAGEEEARMFASTVEQHIRWLSEGRFRQYYRLTDPVQG